LSGSKNKPKPPLVVTRDVEPTAAMLPHVLEIPSCGIGICVLAGTGAIADVSLCDPGQTRALLLPLCHIRR
jgi:hypothetical protein